MQDFNKDKEVAAKKHTHWRLYYIHVTSTQFSLILPSELAQILQSSGNIPDKFCRLVGLHP